MNKKELECLRDLTRLGLIGSIKVFKARRNNPDIDEVDELEYSLRMRNLMMQIEKSWDEYIWAEYEGLSKAEFAQMYLENYGRKKEEKQKVKKLS